MDVFTKVDFAFGGGGCFGGVGPHTLVVHFPTRCNLVGGVIVATDFASNLINCWPAEPRGLAGMAFSSATVVASLLTSIGLVCFFLFSGGFAFGFATVVGGTDVVEGTKVVGEDRVVISKFLIYI